MSAKEQAIQDIKEDLKKEGKAFISYRQELNGIMKKIVKEYTDAQKQSVCITGWSFLT